MGKKVQQTQAFVIKQTSLEGLALRSRHSHRGAMRGYDTNHGTNLGTLNSEHATEGATGTAVILELPEIARRA